MATTSPDNIWTPDAGDAYALTTDLATMADTIQDALSRRSGSGTGAPAYAAQAGDTYFDTATGLSYRHNGTAWFRSGSGVWVANGTGAETGSLLTAGSSIQVAALSTAIAIPMGAVIHFSGSVYIRNSAAGTFAGNVLVRSGSGSSGLATLNSRRWHTQGAAPATYIPFDYTHRVSASLASGSPFSIAINSDPGSAGPVEVWALQFSVWADA